MLTLLLSLFIQCAHANGVGGGFVGNGGDAVVRDGQLRLRDLVIAGVDSHPYIGAVADNVIEHRILSSAKLQQLGVDLPTLARKLSDIEQLWPGAAFVIQTVLEAHDFRWSQEALPLLPDSSWKDPSDPRVQLAIRRDMVIQLDREKWLQLSSLNQVALLLHEAFFSLVFPEPQGNGDPSCVENECAQPAPSVHALTGLSFSDLRQGRIAAAFEHLLDTQVHIADFDTACKTNELKFDFYSATSSGFDQRIAGSVARLTDSFVSQTESVCKFLAHNPDARTEITVEFESLSLTERRYKTAGGSQLAWGLVVVPVSVGPVQTNVTADSSCSASLTQAVRKLVTGLSSDRAEFCQSGLPKILPDFLSEL